jgi:glycosyltransferase involved in cell wall biosynthesis
LSDSLSVIIPAYNSTPFLAEAIASVRAQNWPVSEIVVVDDGSQDGTGELAHQLGVRCHPQENRGPSAARNQGLKLTQGRYLAFLDADDLWAPDNLERLMPALLADPQAWMAQGLIQKQVLTESGWISQGSPYPFINLGSTIFRREALERVGPFAEDLWQSEDTDWFMRAWELDLKKLVLDHVALFYRLHHSNLTLSQGGPGPTLVRLLKRHLDRQRSRGASTQAIAGRPSWENYRG